MDKIHYKKRNDDFLYEEEVPGENILKWCYTTGMGKLSLFLLFKRKFLSALGGFYMNTSFSAKRIEKFIANNHVEMDDYALPASAYRTFNDFFVRKLKPGARPIAEGVVSPADGRVLAFQNMTDVQKFFVKGRAFSVSEFLGSHDLADKYINGSMFIVRLAPVDYHRYHFPCSGVCSKCIEIAGDYFSVSPWALRKSLQIFLDNKRSLSFVESQEYGSVAIVEVGATMVGSIFQTYKTGTAVTKGEEKGYFAFGGSTVVLFFEQDRVRFDPELVANTKLGFETFVKMGEQIAV